MKEIAFLKPSWKKLYWLFLVFLIAELYNSLIAPMAPNNVIAQFVSFVLHPISLVFSQQRGVEMEIILPIARTIDLMWMYVVACILAKEISKEKS
ncbi:Uncharacterised protein [uncultured archaeon]|nr:Uncharacterised protein [uncultured archaeon]